MFQEPGKDFGSGVRLLEGLEKMPELTQQEVAGRFSTFSEKIRNDPAQGSWVVPSMIDALLRRLKNESGVSPDLIKAAESIKERYGSMPGTQSTKAVSLGESAVLVREKSKPIEYAGPIKVTINNGFTDAETFVVSSYADIPEGPFKNGLGYQGGFYFLKEKNGAIQGTYLEDGNPLVMSTDSVHSIVIGRNKNTFTIRDNSITGTRIQWPRAAVAASPVNLDASQKRLMDSPLRGPIGGIDFRTMEMMIQPMGRFNGLDFTLPALSQVQNINVDEELLQVRTMVDNKIMPSGERIKELLAAIFAKNELDRRADDFLVCLVDICRLQEELVDETSPQLREALVIFDTQKFVVQ